MTRAAEDSSNEPSCARQTAPSADRSSMSESVTCTERPNTSARPRTSTNRPAGIARGARNPRISWPSTQTDHGSFAKTSEQDSDSQATRMAAALLRLRTARAVAGNVDLALHAQIMIEADVDDGAHEITSGGQASGTGQWCGDDAGRDRFGQDRRAGNRRACDGLPAVRCPEFDATFHRERRVA